MKKIVTFLLLINFLGLNHLAFASDTSNHNFDLFLPAEYVPFGGGSDGGGGGGGDSGISSGAITGIILGSIGGVALLGGLAWALKPYWAKGLKTGCAQGLSNPIMAMCLDDKTVSKFKAQSQTYPYLVKALEMNKINDCPKSKYILVPDSVIQNDTVDSVCFEIPSDMGEKLKVVITQVSNPYEHEEFKTELYINANKEEVNYKDQIKLETFLSGKNEGLTQMMGEIDLSKTSSTGALVISFENKKDKNITQKYAYLIEFSGI